MRNLERSFRVGLGAAALAGLSACAPDTEPTVKPVLTPIPASSTSPRPTETPKLQPTISAIDLTSPTPSVVFLSPTPEEYKNPFLAFNFSDGVPETQRQEIRDAATKFITWFNDKTGVSLSGITVYADDNPERIVDLYLSRTDFPEDMKKREKENSVWWTAWAGRHKDFFIKTTSDGWTKSSPIIDGPVKEGRAYTVAHELWHVYQMMLEAHKDSRNIPYWLWEGSAHYIAPTFLLETNIYSDHARIKNGHISQAMRMAELLESLETEIYYRAGSPNTADQDSLGYLATARLTRNLPDGGVKELSEFWKKVGEGVPWRTAFQQVFGMTTQDFYKDFEDWRKKGFKD